MHARSGAQSTWRKERSLGVSCRNCIFVLCGVSCEEDRYQQAMASVEGVQAGTSSVILVQGCCQILGPFYNSMLASNSETP